MGDPMTRKNATLSRLRQQLRKKRESLADQFDFKMYMVFHFKEQPKVSRSRLDLDLAIYGNHKNDIQAN